MPVCSCSVAQAAVWRLLLNDQWHSPHNPLANCGRKILLDYVLIASECIVCHFKLGKVTVAKDKFTCLVYVHCQLAVILLILAVSQTSNLISNDLVDISDFLTWLIWCIESGEKHAQVLHEFHISQDTIWFSYQYDAYCIIWWWIVSKSIVLKRGSAGKTCFHFHIFVTSFLVIRQFRSFSVIIFCIYPHLSVSLSF